MKTGVGSIMTKAFHPHRLFNKVIAGRGGSSEQGDLTRRAPLKTIGM
jgi:hypothetical protein